MSSIYVARQPIFEHGKGLYGYELLYRRDEKTERAEADSGYMSADVIVGSLLGLGIRTVAESGVAFVNFSRGQLLGKSWELFDPGAVVVELLETVDCDAETIAACEQLVNAGYTLALDDYVEDATKTRFLELASIVKIDVLDRSPAELLEIAERLRPHGVRLLAERVETAAVRDMCAGYGYELFQGYLFSRPETLSKTDVSAGQFSIMRLLDLLQNPLTSDSSLEKAFQTDVALCYKLLRMVNAAAVGGRGIDSISHAIRLVGRRTLHQWLAVIFVASLGRRGDVTHEIALTAITRGRMCELLAANSGEKSIAGSAFIVGLLSLLDVLLEVPMPIILDSIDLSAEVRVALLRRSGALGRPLALVEAYEKAEWDVAERLAPGCGVPDDILSNLYIDSLHWAAQRIAA
jgi:EAL and modified HD-GYP domain-containing signal transduction protein